jgi:hypothetical protein
LNASWTSLALTCGKEQSANLYATKMAEHGFVALSLDLSWGESEGEPRNALFPDIYSEDFSAAVDRRRGSHRLQPQSPSQTRRMRATMRMIAGTASD